jgi:hypothetical protein
MLAGLIGADSWAALREVRGFRLESWIMMGQERKYYMARLCTKQKHQSFYYNCQCCIAIFRNITELPISTASMDVYTNDLMIFHQQGSFWEPMHHHGMQETYVLLSNGRRSHGVVHRHPALAMQTCWS